MARLRVCITIAASPKSVWRELEQIERHPQWMEDCVAIRFAGRKRRGVGTRFVAVTRVLGITLDDAMEIVRWSPGRAMGVVHHGVVSGTGEFRLRGRLGGGTRLCWTERLRFPWFLGGPAGALVAVPILRHIWRHSLTNLKARVEAG